MLMEKCHADSLSAHSTALESRTNKLKSRLYCSLPPASDPESTQAMPQPYPRALLAMYCTKETRMQTCRSMLRHSPLQSTQVNHSPVVVAMNIFKEIYLET